MNVIPEMGKAFLWYNVEKLPAGNRSSMELPIDTSTFHEAKPVTKGEKWIVTKWLRAGMFT